MGVLFQLHNTIKEKVEAVHLRANGGLALAVYSAPFRSPQDLEAVIENDAYKMPSVFVSYPQDEQITVKGQGIGTNQNCRVDSQVPFNIAFVSGDFGDYEKRFEFLDSIRTKMIDEIAGWNIPTADEPTGATTGGLILTRHMDYFAPESKTLICLYNFTIAVYEVA